MKRLWLYIVTGFSEVVFYMKHRAGFMDLGITVDVTGTVASIEGTSSDDGDFSFNVLLDSYCSGLAALLGPVPATPVIHCEVMPKARLRRAFPPLASGQRVRVVGRWAFDGAHSDEYATKGLTAKELLSALWGRQPNPHGWTEIHPVVSVEVLP